MKWNVLKRQALKHGFQFVKHGKEHDEYYNPKNRRNRANWKTWEPRGTQGIGL